MSNRIIQKSITLNASPQKVWQVLMESPYIDEWYAEFGEDLKVETDWSTGSKYRVVDSNGLGMVGKIAENVPGKTLSIESEGMVKDNKDDFESPEAKMLKGNRETYWLSETAGGTKLDIESACFEEYADLMADMWDKALIKIKQLAEK
ncbi:MAG: SRPBCC domain-containing protein [Flavobacterium psychrophilum]|nr:MAG: SRPBCC domain-containing protein [Flavobacterium psychrophilum]